VIEKFFTKIVTIKSSDGRDQYGDPSTWTDTTTTKGWLFRIIRRFGEGEDENARRDPLHSSYVLRLPAGTQIGPYDTVLIDGQIYAVDGPPVSVPTPYDPEHHVRVGLVQVNG